MSTLPPTSLPAPPADVSLAPLESITELDDLITEDHKPVDRIFTEKQYRLLTRCLYAGWKEPVLERPFLVLVNVGWFYQHRTPAVVPDCMLSLGIACPDDLHVKDGHSYYQSVHGKPPEVVIEIVSDKTGGEEGWKKDLYAELDVAYYAIFDPEQILNDEILRLWQLRDGQFEQVEPGFWSKIGLGLKLWKGTFEGHTDTWLRWCDENGEVIPTGEERAAKEAQRADKEAQRADKAAERIRELEDTLRRLQEPSQQQPPSS